MTAENQRLTSAGLIASIIAAGIIFVSCTETSENDFPKLVWLFPGLWILTLGYTLTYKTKSGWVLLAVFSVLSVLGFLVFAWLKGMAAAFQH